MKVITCLPAFAALSIFMASGAFAEDIKPKSDPQIEGPVLPVLDMSSSDVTKTSKSYNVLFDDDDEETGYQDPFGRGCSSGYHPTS
jgi:hypothetical protein